MELFHDMLLSVHCSDTRIVLTFYEGDLMVALTYWEWVNGADDHFFTMVVGAGHCGWNEHRIPFTVKSIECDENLNTAYMNGIVTDFITATEHYHFTFGVASPLNKPSRRGLWHDIFHSGDDQTQGSTTLSGSQSATTEGLLDSLVHHGEPSSTTTSSQQGHQTDVSLSNASWSPTVTLDSGNGLQAIFESKNLGLDGFMHVSIGATDGAVTFEAFPKGMKINVPIGLTLKKLQPDGFLAKTLRFPKIKLLAWSIPLVYYFGPAVQFRYAISTYIARSIM